VSLNPQHCRVDAFAFERLGEPRPGGLAEEDGGAAALHLYRGDLLPSELAEPWSASLRERLKARFIRKVRTVGERYERASEFQHAVELCTRGLEADDLTEAFYQGLMRCHLALGCPTDAIAAYRRMRQLFGVMLGIKPSAESERLDAMEVGAGGWVPEPAVAITAKWRQSGRV
jgi:two-component SAPR family response regulator